MRFKIEFITQESWRYNVSVRVFPNGPGDLGSIPGHVIPITFKMVLDTNLLNTQLYKVRIKGKFKQPRENSSALPYTSVNWKGSLLIALDEGRFGFFV